VRRSLVILLVAPTALGGLAYARTAIHGPANLSFALAVSPFTQAAPRGAAVTYSVDIRRLSGFRAPVRLTIAALPQGVHASWELPSGAVTSAPANVQDGAKLSLRVMPSARLGRRRAIVRATARGRTLERRLWLTVTMPIGPRFSIGLSPARQVVARGSAARYRVRVSRFGGFLGPVGLRLLAVPAGERATFTGRTLVVTTSARQPTSTHRLVVVATAWPRGRRMRRYAVSTLTPAAARRFTIHGGLASALFPGADEPLDLTLTNPDAFRLRIRALHVVIQPVTSEPGCRSHRHYGVSQYAGPYPLTLAPGRTQLGALVPRAAWPRISMYDLPSNQDVCKGATVRLAYSGTATR
jgi:hypothetical protein